MTRKRIIKTTSSSTIDVVCSTAKSILSASSSAGMPRTILARDVVLTSKTKLQSDADVATIMAKNDERLE